MPKDIMAQSNVISLIPKRKRTQQLVEDARDVFRMQAASILNLTNKIDNSGFKEKGTALKLPISPTRVLVLDDLYDEPSSQYYPTSENTAVEINTLSWINTHRFMISHRDTDEVIKEIIDYQDNKK